MSNELESDIARVLNLVSFGIDGVGYDETETDPPSSTNPQWQCPSCVSMQGPVEALSKNAYVKSPAGAYAPTRTPSLNAADL